MSLARDLSIDFLKCAEGSNDELWMLCARCSGSISVIENVHQLVSVFLLLRRLFQLFYKQHLTFTKFRSKVISFSL